MEKLNGHTPAGPYRGQKYSPYEAGTRVPFILRWPKHVTPGTSDALVCQIDLFNSFAALTGGQLEDHAAPDSFNVLPALLGESRQGRDHLVEHANKLSLRKGNWKFIPPGGQNQPQRRNLDQPQQQRPQPAQAEFYNLSTDPAEKNNLAKEHPDKVKELSSLLQDLRTQDRTRP